LAHVVSLDLVRRSFRRDQPNGLWLTDITEHPTREGKLYCCVVLDTFSRRVVGWSIDSTQKHCWCSTRSGWPPSAANTAMGS
jgi:putative transposase